MWPQSRYRGRQPSRYPRIVCLSLTEFPLVTHVDSAQNSVLTALLRGRFSRARPVLAGFEIGVRCRQKLKKGAVYGCLQAMGH